jgi:hypothetical protein
LSVPCLDLIACAALSATIDDTRNIDAAPPDDRAARLASSK